MRALISEGKWLSSGEFASYEIAVHSPLSAGRDMLEKRKLLHRALLLSTCVAFSGCALSAWGATCSTQSQMSATQRSGFMGEAHTIGAIVQSGDIQALRAKILPAIASDFDGIAATVTSLKPQVQNATMTVDSVYLLDASKDAPGAERTQFFCGSPIVVLTFNGIPPGTYALVILHATGVPQPQQISLILASAPGNQWQLAGFYAKPMIHADHDGLWYWVSARKYAQSKDNWTAWLYYHIAQGLLSPVDFLSSPNLQKLQQEAEQTHPKDFPAEKTQVSLNAQGASYNLSAVDTTTQFGGLDLDVHYIPNPTQAAQLRTPTEARKQVTDVMTALLAQHPGLRQAFHGMWVHADQGDSSLFALELPMDQIAPGTQPQASNNAPPAVH